MSRPLEGGGARITATMTIARPFVPRGRAAGQLSMIIVMLAVAEKVVQDTMALAVVMVVVELRLRLLCQR